MAAPRLETLFDRETIARRVDELAREIEGEHAGDELVVIGVLDGAFVFAADLVRALSIPCRVQFVTVSSYIGTRGASPRMLDDRSESLEGSALLVVDDIVDSGRTLAFLMEHLRRRRPASLKSCARLARAGRAQPAVDHVGFEIGAGWVVGYGMDRDGRFRDLPHLAVLEGYESESSA